MTLVINVPPVNEALRPKFLDLKEGATVISLSPFVSSINARLTKRKEVLALEEKHPMQFLG